ncbi:MAG: DUF2934 domain-containing protein [Gammaproteobacteria bacterium]|nr:DUF2934 domain-containing protein [Gammaproteobacteria bacterium]
MATKKSTTTKNKRTTPAKTKRSRARRPAAAQPGGNPGKAVEISQEERWRMIAVAAYHKAEQRGFAPGHAVDDWLAAEREVDALLGAADR